MYAVIRTGGKQYRVAEGDVLRIEKLDAEPGATYEFTDVLLVGDGDNITVGKPVVPGGRVTAEVQQQGKLPKVDIVKFRRRQGYLRMKGHRQRYTQVKVTGISLDA
jgi:large subunit ribosomal protein L21